MNLLYVEDDRLSRKVMRLLVAQHAMFEQLTMFEDSHNFEVQVAELDPKPDMILLDIHVDPLNGFDMLELLRSNIEFDNTPIVALTASVMNEEVQKLKTAGFDGIIAKPLDPEKFPHILERIMHGEQVWTIAH